MRNKKLIVAFLGMLPHDREFHGFQLFFFSFSAGTQPLFFCTASSSHLTSCLHSLISIELFLLTTLPNSSSSENPPLVPVISLSTFLLCFLFLPSLYQLHCLPLSLHQLHCFNHHHGKVVTSLPHVSCMQLTYGSRPLLPSIEMPSSSRVASK